MSKNELLSRLVENKILVGCITAGVITFVGIVWNLEARVSVIESAKAERAQIVKVHDEDKSALWRKYGELSDKVSVNTADISFLKGSHHE